MVFWLIVVILIIIALSFVLIPYWRKIDTIALDNNELNILLYKRRLSELEADLNNDVLDKEQYDAAISELKLQLLSDVPENQESSENEITKASQWSKQTIITTLLLLPVLSISLYILLGNKDIATGNVDTTAAARQENPEIEKMISGLAKRLEAQPDNVRGWMMLGRSYAAINQYGKALSAYEKAYTLRPEDADVLTSLAETQAILHNNQFQGLPLKLIKKALEINNTHPRALWLAGHAQVQLGNNSQAIKYWQTLLSTLPPGHESAQTVRKFITQIGDQTGNQTDIKKEPQKKNSKQKNNKQKNDDTGIRIRVMLADKFKSTVPQGTTVFVFARAAKGPRIPLAGTRLKLSDLPAEVVLSDSNAMMPDMTISGVDQVIIGARISKSGGPISKPGDLEGYSPVISSAHPEILEIIIDQIAK